MPSQISQQVSQLGKKTRKILPTYLRSTPIKWGLSCTPNHLLDKVAPNIVKQENRSGIDKVISNIIKQENRSGFLKIEGPDCVK